MSQANLIGPRRLKLTQNEAILAFPCFHFLMGSQKWSSGVARTTCAPWFRPFSTLWPLAPGNRPNREGIAPNITLESGKALSNLSGKRLSWDNRCLAPVLRDAPSGVGNERHPTRT